ncbi:hypothetical protein K438DRAFT_1821449 [Mycena galopus ATCC 62051]|nr:hypothetical protein K438DRAFT_1821449 [Mycena galopus ATCC 62051]
MAPCELPQELIEEILDHLGFDDLKTSSLVCRAWVSRTRSHLFQFCTIYPSNVLALRDLLRATNCTFVSYIRSIRALRNAGHENDHIFNEIAANLTVANIRKLDLRLIRKDDSYEFYCTGFVAAFPHVTRLALLLRQSRTEVGLPLIDLICLFPSLRELHIRWPTTMIADPSPSSAPPRRLHSVHLIGRTASPILAWLHTSNHLPTVDSVAVPNVPVDSQEVSVVGAALQQIGHTLRYLDINLSWLLPVYDLALHPNLENLTIHDIEPDDLDDLDPQRLLPIVTRLAAPKLQRLSLDLNLSYYQNSNWAELDAFLCPTRFPSLRSVTVKCTGGRHLDHDNHAYLHASLPLLVALGMLQTKWD